jgi:hypothetical protein
MVYECTIGLVERCLCFPPGSTGAGEKLAPFEMHRVQILRNLISSAREAMRGPQDWAESDTGPCPHAPHRPAGGRAVLYGFFQEAPTPGVSFTFRGSLQRYWLPHVTDKGVSEGGREGEGSTEEEEEGI